MQIDHVCALTEIIHFRIVLNQISCGLYDDRNFAAAALNELHSLSHSLLNCVRQIKLKTSFICFSIITFLI